MELIMAWKQRAKLVEVDIHALYLAFKHPRVPLYAKLFMLGVIAYVYSPIDLIPDFIPFFGYLDDLAIVCLGIPVALKLVPQDILEECRAKARKSATRTN